MNIQKYYEAGYPCVAIITHEESRAESSILSNIEPGADVYMWSCTSGFLDVRNQRVIDQKAQAPLAMIECALKQGDEAIFIVFDFHLFLTPDNPNPTLVRKLKDAFTIFKKTRKMMVIISCKLRLPADLEKEIYIEEFKLPSREEIGQILDALAEPYGIDTNTNRDRILDAASGLTTNEAENAFALSITQHKAVLPDVIADIKAAVIRKSGILEIIPHKFTEEDIGGLDVLKAWLKQRRLAFSKEAREYGLPVPKGVLVVGIPGTGKSMTAQACAAMLSVPLVKLDIGRIFGGIVGESERNMRMAIQTAEAAAPCVVFIDELEKSLSGSKSSGRTDGGTSARVFGTFLQWMNDKSANVFIVATANDVSALPPELLRKGRFDELFFVDLPNEEERKEIWNVQIRRHGRDPKKLDVNRHALDTPDFTGSEIESCVREALFESFAAGKELDDESLGHAIRNTVPLSKTMAEDLDGLRKWSEGRARRASSCPIKDTGTKTRAMKV